MFVFLLQDERRKASVEGVIDAIAAKQRARDRRTFDEGTGDSAMQYAVLWV